MLWKHSILFYGEYEPTGDFFKAGLAQLVKRLSPETIIVYGRAPDSIFKSYRNMGINIISFESEFSKSRKQVTA